MPDQIVSVQEIERRARKAFMNGEGANSNPFNWHSAAYKTWNNAYRNAREQHGAREATRSK